MEKGASSWLTAIPIKDLGFDLNKAQFWDAIKLRHDWEITDLPSVCVCGEAFSVDHAMICRRGGFVIQRHNELRDLEAEMLDMVCYDVEVEPVLQVLTGETLERGANTAPDWIFMLEVFGKDRGLRSLMSGFFTQMQTLIGISHLSKSIANMRMSRNASTPLEF